MPLDSLSFLCLFLPIGLIIYYLVPKRGRNAALLAIGLCFYLLNDPYNLPLMLISLGTDYIFYRLFCRYVGFPEVQRAFLTGALLKNAGFLLLAFGFSIFGAQKLPLGIFIYTFSSVDLFLGLWRREVRALLSPVDFFLWHTLFFRLYAGPFVPPSEFARQISSRVPDASRMLEGIYLFLQGLAIKLLLVNQLYSLYGQLTPVPTFQLSFFGAWLTLLTGMFYLLFSLESWCRMARGIGAMFGFSLPRNIFYPLLADSIGRFLGRFNSSVTALLRRRFSQPLRHRFPGLFFQYLITVCCCVMLGVWFSLDYPHLLWGVLMGTLLFLERRVSPARLNRIPPFFRRCFTGIVVVLSFTLLITHTLPDFGGLLYSLFFGNNILLNKRLIYLVSQQYVPLLLGVLLSSGGLFRLHTVCSRRIPRITQGVSFILHLGLGLLCIAYLL